MQLLSYMIIASPFLDYATLLSSLHHASVVNMDVHSLSCVLPNFEGFSLRQDFLDKVKSLWPHRLLEWNMHLTADVTTDDDYKVWVVMQASEPPGLFKYKRTQVLMNESQKKKQRRH